MLCKPETKPTHSGCTRFLPAHRTHYSRQRATRHEQLDAPSSVAPRVFVARTLCDLEPVRQPSRHPPHGSLVQYVGSPDRPLGPATAATACSGDARLDPSLPQRQQRDLVVHHGIQPHVSSVASSMA